MVVAKASRIGDDMTRAKRITTVALTGVTIAVGALFSAAPAHASRNEDCDRLLIIAQWNYNMYEWSRTFYGADSPEAQGYLSAGADAAEFHGGNC
jgi:hypothetical protein